MVSNEHTKSTNRKDTDGDKWFNPSDTINPSVSAKLKLKKEIYPEGFDIQKLKNSLQGYTPNVPIKNYNNMVMETPIVDKAYLDQVNHQLARASIISQKLAAQRLASQRQSFLPEP